MLLFFVYHIPAFCRNIDSQILFYKYIHHKHPNSFFQLVILETLWNQKCYFVWHKKNLENGVKIEILLGVNLQNLKLIWMKNLQTLQSFTKYLRLTQIKREIANYGEILIYVFQIFFSSMNKIYIFARRLGTKLLFYGDFPDISLSRSVTPEGNRMYHVYK